mgnify:CR=1 FL=1
MKKLMNYITEDKMSDNITNFLFIILFVLIIITIIA